MNAPPGSSSVTVIAHRGELVLIFAQPVTQVQLSIQQARDFAANLIKLAEQAEQQMDAERDRE